MATGPLVGEDAMAKLFNQIGRTGLLFFSLDSEEERQLDDWMETQNRGGNGRCGGFIDTSRMDADEIMRYLSETGLRAMLLVRNDTLSDLELLRDVQPRDFEKIGRTIENGHTYRLCFLSHSTLVELQGFLDMFFSGGRKWAFQGDPMNFRELIVPIKKGERIFSILVSLDQVIR